MPDYDVITFGETMLRLSPPSHGRLEEATTLDFRIGGSESNTAVGLARLGRKVAWWSRLPDSPLGRKVAMLVGRWGVDTSHVLWTESGRVGVYFIEFGAPPRPHQVYYDRADSAISQLAPDMVDWDQLDRARHLHITGITAALGEGCALAVAHAASEARRRGLTVSLDVNYRSKLWTTDKARETLIPILRDVNLLFCPMGDAAQVFGITDSPARVARALQQKYRVHSIVVTGSPEGVAAVHGDQTLRSDNTRAMEVDRIGSGDAGNAGILHGYLDGDLQKGLRYGSAMAALKLTVPGDELIVTRQEIEDVVNGVTGGVRR